MYRVLGRAAIRFSVRYMRARYGRRLRIGAAIVGVGVVAGVAAYLTAREVPEG